MCIDLDHQSYFGCSSIVNTDKTTICEVNNMTTAIAPVQSTTCFLEQQLSILNAEQQEALFAYYGKDGLAKFDGLKSNNSTPGQFESALADFINNDSNEAQRVSLLKQLEEYNVTYRLREEQYSSAEDIAKAALTAKRDAKKGLNESVSKFTKTLEKNLTGTNKELLQQRRIDNANQQAWEKREKIRVRGIDAYLKGVVAAVIDDMEQEYRQEANEKADKISKIAKTQVNALKDKGEEPTSMKGTNLILKNSFPKNKEQSPMSKAARQGLNNAAMNARGNDSELKPKPVVKN